MVFQRGAEFPRPACVAGQAGRGQVRVFDRQQVQASQLQRVVAIGHSKVEHREVGTRDAREIQRQAIVVTGAQLQFHPGAELAVVNGTGPEQERQGPFMRRSGLRRRLCGGAGRQVHRAKTRALDQHLLLGTLQCNTLSVGDDSIFVVVKQCVGDCNLARLGQHRIVGVSEVHLVVNELACDSLGLRIQRQESVVESTLA